MNNCYYGNQMIYDETDVQQTNQKNQIESISTCDIRNVIKYYAVFYSHFCLLQLNLMHKKLNTS